MKTRGRAGIIISLIVVGLMMLFLIGSGVAAIAKGGAVPLDTAQKGEVCEFTAQYAFKAFEISHSVNLIPTGSEHYYLMYSSDGTVEYLVRAKPSWIKKRFGASGLAVGNSQKIKGLVTSLDYEIKDEVRELNAEMQSEHIGTVSASYYIDTRYKELGWMRIFSGIGYSGIFLFMRLATVNGMLHGNKFLKGVFAVVFLGISVMLLYTISVGGVWF
ncbi:MAG: hypothetical protein K2J77_00495 [Oscillospiraceae bacterium]|nr:hypothetical protein [Oscillospiraceae bacterium]